MVGSKFSSGYWDLNYVEYTVVTTDQLTAFISEQIPDISPRALLGAQHTTGPRANGARRGGVWARKYMKNDITMSTNGQAGCTHTHTHTQNKNKHRQTDRQSRVGLHVRHSCITVDPRLSGPHLSSTSIIQRGKSLHFECAVIRNHVYLHMY